MKTTTMHKTNTEVFKNPINLVRPLTVDRSRRFDRNINRHSINIERRPKTSVKKIQKEIHSEFISNSTSTVFSFASDEDYDTDLEDDTNQFRDHSCIGLYKHVCRQNKIVPVGKYMKNFDKSELSLDYYGLGPKGMRGFIPSLTMNQHLTKLDLESNGLGDEGIIYLSSILRDNVAVSDLNISQNFIGIDGAKALCDMFKDNITINHLKLEANLFDDGCAPLFGELISSTGQLHTLNLSKNRFGPMSGHFFGPALAENTTMHSLDLSWNSIGGKGAISLIKGVQKNIFLKALNLARNGLAGAECGRAWLQAFKENNTLVELDLSNNRLTTEPATQIGRALSKCESLEIIRLTGNPLESAGCYAILKPLMSKRAIPNKLKIIDLTEILFNNDFHKLYLQVTTARPELQVLIGLRKLPALLKDDQIHHPTPAERLHTLLQRRPQLDLRQFFLSIATDSDCVVNEAESRITDHAKLKQAIHGNLGGRFSDSDIEVLLKEVAQIDCKKFVQIFDNKPSTISLSSSSWRFKN